MSLYNKLFGENEEAGVILGFVGLNKSMFVRYRDCYLNIDGTIVTVVTRLGGDNRKDYKYVFNNVKKNKHYIRNFDDDFDNTYCYFEFKIPDKFISTAKIMAPKEPRLSVGDMFKKEIEEAKIEGSPAAKRQEEIANAIFNAMESGDHFITL